MYKKTIFILLLFTILMTSCRSKKQVSCPSCDIETEEEKNTININFHNIISPLVNTHCVLELLYNF